MEDLPRRRVATGDSNPKGHSEDESVIMGILGIGEDGFAMEL